MNEELITKYIASWMWHLIAVIFFNGLLLTIILQRYSFILIFVGAIVVTEVMAWKRKGQIENEI